MNFKRFSEGKNILPASSEQTIEVNGITYRSDGQGGYYISGTAKAFSSARFNISDFVIPFAVGRGGNGTFSMFNNGTTTTSAAISFMKNGVNIDEWNFSTNNRTSTSYSVMGGKDIDQICFRVNTGVSINVTIKPMFTNDRHLPSEFEPHMVCHDTPHYIHNTSTDTITTLPAVLYPNATTATVGLKGQAVQSTTPTPQNPVMPNGCGERTGNLFDKNATNANNGYISNGYLQSDGSISTNISYRVSEYIRISQNQPYFLYYGANLNAPSVCFYDSTKNYISGVSYSGRWDVPFTTPQNAEYLRLSFRAVDVGNIKLNEGSNVLPYEPYGYKLEISSGGTTTPVYLGEVETTRKIGKIDLGVLNWNKGLSGNFIADTAISDCRIIGNYQVGNAICTHLSEVSGDVVANTPYGFASCLNNTARLYINKTGFENLTAEEFKEAMSGVYMYYVLKEPETGIVNEPLMKIGEYADEISGISIPVTAGGDTISVDTTVQPSEVTANYHGWHPVADVHVYPDSSWMPTSWEEFRKAVRSGKAQSLYPVGTKLYENWGDTTSDAWIVVDYPTGEDYLDSDLAQQGYTNRVMLMEEKINYLRQFDAIEAWLYAETAIPAGTYRFKIPNYDATYGGNKTYIFTSTADVPVGGQLTLTWAYQQNPSAVQAYSSSTATSTLFNVSIAEWDGTTPCTDLGTIKLAMSDADSTYGKLNHIHRARYGSNNYAQSGIRQWFNSDAAANAWWQPTTIFDRPYGNRNTAGRLNTMDNDMKSIIATPTINCITNNLFESPSLDGTTFALQTAYTIQDKLFPVTHTEINLSSTPNVDSVLSQYIGADNADRIKYRADNGNAYYWWLRTPYPTYAYLERHVGTSGALSNYNANSTYGGVAACIIQ